MITSCISFIKTFILNIFSKPTTFPSSSSYYFCNICLRSINNCNLYSQINITCGHTVCIECMRSYFYSVLEKNRYKQDFTLIPCSYPGCLNHFDSNQFLDIIFTKEEMDAWWGLALSKTYIENEVSCPMENCNAIFDAKTKDIKKCIVTECYECHRVFCMACQDKWHPGVIKIFPDEKGTKEALKLAISNKWSRCPNCNHCVERTDGCWDIHCRCGKNFCYRCGGDMPVHNKCKQNCASFSQRKLIYIRQAMFARK